VEQKIDYKAAEQEMALLPEYGHAEGKFTENSVSSDERWGYETHRGMRRPSS
jgi:hypothetical protein